MIETTHGEDLVASEGSQLRESGEGEMDFSVPGTVRRRIRELGVSVLFGLMSVAIALPPYEGYRLTWLSLLMFVMICLHFGRRAADASPRFVVDELGITDRTSIFGGTLRLAWDEILAVAPARWLNGVDLRVRDLSRVRGTVGLGRQVEMLVTKFFGKRTVSVDLTFLGVTKQELSSRIETALFAAERRQLGFSPTVNVLSETTEDRNEDRGAQDAEDVDVVPTGRVNRDST